MMWLSSIIQPATRERTLGVSCVPALEDAHFGVAAHLWGPFPACTVVYNALKEIQPPPKHMHGAGHHHIRMGIMSQGQVLQHPDVSFQQGHPDPAAGDTCVSPWLLLPRCFMANISYVEKSRAGHPNLVLPCVNTRSSPLPGMLQVPWGATNPPRAVRRVSGPGGRLGLGGAGSWAGDDVLRGSEELCTSGFLTLAFNIPPQPDGKNK